MVVNIWVALERGVLAIYPGNFLKFGPPLMLDAQCRKLSSLHYDAHAKLHRMKEPGKGGPSPSSLLVG